MPRTRGRSPICRLLTPCIAISGLALVLAACSSGGSSSSGSTSSGSSGPAASSSTSLAPFEQALQADYKGHFTAPPSTAPKPPKNMNLWIISCGQASAGCADPVANSKEAAQLLGWKATVFDGNFGIGDAYDTGIRQAIAAHANAIIVLGVNCNQAKSGFQAAKAAGIPIIGANSYDCSDPQVNDGSDLFTATVKYTPEYSGGAGSIEYADGVAKADWIIVHTNGQAKVINTDFAGLTGGVYMNQGFVAEMAKCKTCQIVKTITYSPPDTSNGNLKNAFSSAVVQYPQANAAVNISDGIVLPNDFPQAIQSAGRTSSFCIVSTEGYAAATALIRGNDGICAETPFDSNWLGWGAVDTVIRVLDHQPAVYEGMGVQVIDATHNLPASGVDYKAPVNYKADYEKAWGVSA